MKLHVICDQDGNIASLHSAVVSGPQASISAVGVKPGPGQTLHSIDVSEELKSLSLKGIHSECKVKLGSSGPELVQSARGR